MAERKRQRIRDPLHNLVEFDEGDSFDRTLWRVIQTPAFQRLRRVRQLGFSDLVYPGATHSRFSHSIGVLHTARRLMEIVDRFVSRQPRERIQREATLAAALVHDVGHGPFSHAFEQVGKAFGWPLVAEHEAHSLALIRSEEPGSIGAVLNRHDDGFADRVAEVLHGGPASVYRSVVSSQFDADRLDYVRRDRLMTGTGLAAIDFEWLIANLEIDAVPDDGRRTFVLGAKALHAAEGFVTGLFQMYPNVYFHKATRGAEKLMQEMLRRVMAAAAEGRATETGLPDRHPLIRLASDGGALPVLAELDDFVIWGALPMLREATDVGIAKIAGRLAHRRLFKCRDLGAMLERGQGDTKSKDFDGEYRRRISLVKDQVRAWSESTDRQGRILIDEASRQPYKPVEAEGPLNQIWIRDGGNLVDLRDLSAPVRASRTWRLFRLYVAEGDTEAMRFVDDLTDRMLRRET